MTAGLVVFGQPFPAAGATDVEVTTAVSDHAAAADPHTGYRREADGKVFVPLSPIVNKLNVTGATLQGQNDVYQDLDLSSAVPAGATAVVLGIYTRDTGIGSGAWSLWRRKGDTSGGTVGADGAVVEVHAQTYYASVHITVGVDSNRFVQYKPHAFGGSGSRELYADVIGYYI